MRYTLATAVFLTLMSAGGYAGPVASLKDAEITCPPEGCTLDKAQAASTPAKTIKKADPAPVTIPAEIMADITKLEQDKAEITAIQSNLTATQRALAQLQQQLNTLQVNSANCQITLSKDTAKLLADLANYYPLVPGPKPPDPPPGPGPGPEPKPPEPVPQPSKLRILLMYDDIEIAKVSNEELRKVIFSEAAGSVRAYMNSHCLTDSAGEPERRIWPTNSNTANAGAEWQPLVKALDAKPKPCIVIQAGDTIKKFDLPATAAGTVNLLMTYGGK